jgi:hypothetical protein
MARRARTLEKINTAGSPSPFAMSIDSAPDFSDAMVRDVEIKPLKKIRKPRVSKELQELREKFAEFERAQTSMANSMAMSASLDAEEEAPTRTREKSSSPAKASKSTSRKSRPSVDDRFKHFAKPTRVREFKAYNIEDDPEDAEKEIVTRKIRRHKEVFVEEPRQHQSSRFGLAFLRAVKAIVMYLAIALAIVGLIYGGGATYKKYYQKPVKEEQKTNQYIDEVRKVYIFPSGETPTVALVKDAASLAAQQSFYKAAQNGDVLLIFSQSQIGVLYRPTAKAIVNVATVQVAQPSQNAGQNQQVQPNQQSQSAQSGQSTTSSQTSGQ